MAIKDRLAEIVGKDNVLDSPEAMGKYGRDYSTEPPGLFTCVVRPKDATRFNTPVWVERFQKEFNPKGLANPGFPYFGDRQAEVMPGIITKEILETVKRVQAGRWRGL